MDRTRSVSAPSRTTRRSSTIWDGFQQYFDQRRPRLRLHPVHELRAPGGSACWPATFDVAWNSPLAWLQAERLARLGDAGRRRFACATRIAISPAIVSREGDTGENAGDLRGRRVAVGANDSPQATLIPLYYLAQQGLEPNRDFEVRRVRPARGKHGDHIGGERDAARALLARGLRRRLPHRREPPALRPGGHAASGSARTHRARRPVRSLQLHGPRSAPAAAGARFRELLLGDVVRRPGGAAAARPRGPEALAARPHRRVRAARRRRWTVSRFWTAS